MKRKLMAAAGLVTFLLRLGLVLATQSYRHPTTWEFERVTQNMMAGRGFMLPHLGIPYYSLHPPLYDLLSLMVYTLVGHHQAAILVMQAVFSSLLAALTVHLAHRFTGSLAAGILAGGLVATHPGLLYYDIHHLHPLSFGALLFALILWAAMRWWVYRRIRDAAWLGAAVALAMHERGTAGLFLLPAMVWMGWHLRVHRRRVAASLGALVAGCVLVLAPWTIRNYLVHGRFVLMITLKNEHLWLGNNPRFSGSALTQANEPIFNAIPPELLSRLEAQTNEVDQQRIFGEVAWAYIRQDPGAFVVRTLRKLYYFFWFSPQSGLWYPQRYLHWYRLYYGSVLGLAMVGWVRSVRAAAPRTRAMAWAMVGLILSVAVAQSLCYVEGRHRWGIEPLLLMFTAGGGAWLVERLRQCWWTMRANAGPFVIGDARRWK
ncbi:MAG: glycosyltransferase family 39 protein [Candidatus Omnitrophica bacterium]|nr:glycosyltransferase family 39 protein [Candidatus Omnitrophota bacterium]